MATDARPTYVAAVVGATGATGAALVDALARSPRFSSVTAIARSERDVAAPATRKVEWRQMSLEDLAEEAAHAGKIYDLGGKRVPRPNIFSGVDAVFCALGTTRADAGSARAFWDVDVGGAESVATLAGKAAAEARAEADEAEANRRRRGGPRVLSLVSASGAARNSVFRRFTFPLFHPLYYSAAKGAAEQAFATSGVDGVFLYRPGLLDRGEDRRRSGENLAIGAGFPSLGVRDLARAMVLDAVEALDAEGGAGEVVRGDAEIKRRAAAAAAAAASAAASSR